MVIWSDSIETTIIGETHPTLIVNHLIFRVYLHRVSKSTKIIPMIISKTIMISTSMIVAIMVLTSTKSIITTTIGHIPWAWSWESWNSHHSRSHCKTKSTTNDSILFYGPLKYKLTSKPFAFAFVFQVFSLLAFYLVVWRDISQCIDLLDLNHSELPLLFERHPFV